MIDNYSIEQHILKNINEICDKIEKESSLLILYDKEKHDGELYINFRVYNTNNHELVKHRFDKLTHTYNYLNGMYFGIKFIKED